MKEYFKINNIDIGFADHPTENTGYPKGFLDTKIAVRKGKLRINLLTPSLEINDEIHNGMLSDPCYDGKKHIDYFRIASYPSDSSDIGTKNGKYGFEITCPQGDNFVLGAYEFPEEVEFHGTINIQEGYVHIKGELKSRYQEYLKTKEQKKDYEDYLQGPYKRYRKPLPNIPIEVLKFFDPEPLLPERESHTLAQALRSDPLDVYDLSIEKGKFNSFPSKILEFKNLERITIVGNAKRKFTEIPDEFYELKQLHTIGIYQVNITFISEKIQQLVKLEELSICSSELNTLADSICSLPRLTTLNLGYNELKTLPSQIDSMPNLEFLYIEGNNFESLPKGLLDIPDLRMDKKYLKLLKGMSYKSQNTKPIDESLYDLSRYSMQKAQLEKSIKNIPKLEDFKDLIIDYATMGTFLVVDKIEKEIPIGVSKVGGSPDLPKGWEHPVSKDGLLYLFHAQINCEEVASYQKYLPRKGIIYFFINDEEYAQHPVVLYSDNTNDLVRFSYTEKTKFEDRNFDDFIRKARKVSFQNAISLPNFYNSSLERFPKHASFWSSPDNKEKINTLEDYETFSKLEKTIDKPVGADNGIIKTGTHGINVSVITQHESPQEQAVYKFGGKPNEWMILLNLESIDEFSFWDAGTLTYCIHKKDLAINDFSRVNTSIESS